MAMTDRMLRTAGVALLALTLVGVWALPSAQPSWAATARVAVVDNAYEPVEVRIVAGDSVTWVWEGDNPHSVTSANGSFQDSHPGCSPATTGACGTRGSVHTVTFNQPGSYNYVCKVHGVGMSGLVTVQEPPEPSEEPSAEPSPEPSPQPSPEPSPEPSSEPSPQPTTPAPPSPSPTPTAPDPSPTDASDEPVDEPADEPSPTPPSPTPTPTTSIEAFPSPGATADPEDVGEVAVDVPGGGGPDRTGALLLATAAVVGSLGAFSKVILFGEPWDV